MRFKAIFAILYTFLLAHSGAFAQIYDPVKWEFAINETSGTEAELKFTAIIEEGWHIYATVLSSDMGPVPTEFIFDSSSDFKTLGKIKQGKPLSEYDKNFDMELDFFRGKPVFTQKIERLASKDFKVSGELTYMVCDNEKCLPPEYIPFEFSVKGRVGAKEVVQDNPFGVSSTTISPIGIAQNDDESQIYDPISWEFFLEDETDTSAVVIGQATLDPGWHVYSMYLDSDKGPVATAFNFENENEGYELVGKAIQGEPVITYDPNFQMNLGLFSGKPIFKQKIKKTSAEPVTIQGFMTHMVCDDEKCLPPADAEFSLNLKPGHIVQTANTETIGNDQSTESRRSNWGIFIISFLSGFAALLTPCVFPMIPLTVSYFTKQSKTRAEGIKNAVMYGVSIIVIYVVLGVAVTAAFGASILSEMSTDPWFNLFFFILLVVFAISFLGAFEITLPASWINKADAQADRGGLIGMFFMAFVLALVSFSCTGPIVGTLIVEAASRGGMAPAIGMLGFSLAIALPFALFAAFPGWLNSLPQSGGWLNSVKVVLGFLELALAFKFLSNADMVMDFRFLEREVFIAIWIVIFGLLTLYLLGKLKMPLDSDLKYVSVPRVVLAIFTGMFTIYMIPGMWGAPLKLISAFPPPLQYSESPYGVGFTGRGSGMISTEGGILAENIDVSDKFLGPQNIYVYHDYDKGLEEARRRNIPLMLDFTGKACVNCRKMEQEVWSDPEIKRKIENEVVLVSLYVDFREKLPEEEQITVELTNGRKKKLRTVGDKWAALQEQRFKVNAQPYYVLLDLNEEKLVEAANYQDYGKVNLFNDWLDRGIEKFHKISKNQS